MSGHSPTKVALGITVLEVLLVAAILGVLALIVWVGFASSHNVTYLRNVHRERDLTTIHRAFLRYALDNNGQFQPVQTPYDCSIGTHAKHLCDFSVSRTECVNYGCVYTQHLRETYLESLPHDPFDADSTVLDRAIIDYSVVIDEQGQLTLHAIHAEEEEIFVNGRE